jgi:vitamin B12 transporter
VRIRGAETGQTAWLIDGVKLNDPTAVDSGYNAANLLVNDTDHVEVLRGAQSVLWGSQAIGGVINVITRDPAKPFEAQADAEAGSMNTAYGRLSAGGRSDRIIWRVAGDYYTTDGVSAFDEAKGGKEPDGYHNLGASGKVRVILTDQFSFDLRGVWSRGRSDQDGFPAPAFALGDTPEYSINRDMVGYAGLNLDLMDGRFANRAAFTYTDTTHHNFNPTQTVTTHTFDATGRNRRFEYQGTFKVTDGWTAVFGAEAERATMNSASPSSFSPNPAPIRRSADLDGVYGQLTATVAAGLTLTGGLRYDHHGDFGGHAVGQVSAAWAIAEATVLRASFGQGFKAPSLYQLGSEYGNAALKPEGSNSWDAGVEHRFWNGRLVLSGAWFERRTTNQIDFVSCGSASAPLCVGPTGRFRFGYYDNIVRTKAHGLEVETTAQPTDSLKFTANYSRTLSVNDAPGAANFGKWLARRPRDEANAEASYLWPARLTTAVAVRYAGHSFDDAANRTRVKSYAVWDLRASYPVTDAVEVYGRVENLFDTSYETIFNYGQIGRAAYAGVRARF